jgi:hypothetical protein
MPLKRMGDRGERLPNLVSGYDFSRAAVNPDSREAGFSSTRPLTSFAVYSEGEPDRHAKRPCPDTRRHRGRAAIYGRVGASRRSERALARQCVCVAPPVKLNSECHLQRLSGNQLWMRCSISFAKLSNLALTRWTQPSVARPRKDLARFSIALSLLVNGVVKRRN